MTDPDLWEMSAQALANQIADRKTEGTRAGQEAVEIMIPPTTPANPFAQPVMCPVLKSWTKRTKG
jgi:hypothetical protein